MEKNYTKLSPALAGFFYGNMGKEQLVNTIKYELSPSTRAWVGMKPVKLSQAHNCCTIVYKGRGRMAVTFRNLDLEEISFEDTDTKTPVMKEFGVLLSTSASLDTKVKRDDPILCVDSKWLSGKINEPELLDKPYRPFYPESHSLSEE